MRAAICAITAVLCATAVPAFAEPTIGGKVPLICATVEAMVCERGMECQKGLPENIGAPQFMQIDFEKKAVVGPKRTSPILQTEMDEERITLQGFELGLGWTMAIDRATGHTSMTLVGMDEAYVLFGACTEQTWIK
jgi:hypothetical protein